MSQFPYPQGGVGQGSTKLVIVALGIAAVAVVLVNVYIGMVRTQARGGEFVVYRLQRSVQPGDTLSRSDVVPMVVDERFRDGFPGAMDSLSLEAQLGKATFYRAAPKNAALTHDLFIAPVGGEFAMWIRPDRRGVALPINPRTIPAGVRRGVYVDIEAPFITAGGTTQVLTIIERVEVMALGDVTMSDDEADHGMRPRTGRFDSITIQVTPEQATQLASIKRRVAGDFELHLRNPDDVGRPKIDSEGINPRVLNLILQPQSADNRDLHN